MEKIKICIKTLKYTLKKLLIKTLLKYTARGSIKLFRGVIIE